MIKVIQPLPRGADSWATKARIRKMLAGIDVCVETGSGVLIYQNRNFAISNGGIELCSHVLCLDCDIEITSEQVVALIRHDVDIVSGAYLARGHTKKLCANSIDTPGFLDCNSTGLIQCGMVGAGALLVKSDCMRKLMPYPFRHEIVDGVPTGEDTGFCLHAMRNGYIIWVDADCKVKHNLETGERPMAAPDVNVFALEAIEGLTNAQGAISLMRKEIQAREEKINLLNQKVADLEKEKASNGKSVPAKPDNA